MTVFIPGLPQFDPLPGLYGRPFMPPTIGLRIDDLLAAEKTLRDNGRPTHADGYYVVCVNAPDEATLKRLRGRYPLRRETMVNMAPAAWKSAERQYEGCVPIALVSSTLVVYVPEKT